ncbi:MAG: FAD-dependent oxidoreductase [Tetrasphaera sp.]
MESADRVDVVVVGGGIGGLSNAVALTRKGLRVRVLEQAPEFGEVGAGLQIAPNCTRILNHWELLDEVKSLGVQPDNMIMFDAMDGHELTRIDLRDAEERYGFPYMVIHRSDLHATLLRAAQRLGVDLVTDARCVGYENGEGGATAVFADGRRESAEVVIAADGMHSVARPMVVTDEPVSSAYVAYRGAVPIDLARTNDIHEDAVVVYVGPARHFVQYPLRSGEMFNQVAVFQSPKALAGEEDWGTPDEMDAAFDGSCEQVIRGLPLMWRDRWWRMFDRDPIDNWLAGRVVLSGDAAHPPLQYMAQGAIMAMEDSYVLSEHVGNQQFTRAGEGRQAGEATGIDWETALAAYNAVRPPHCRRVLSTGRVWGELWHVDGEKREIRNALFEKRDTYDYSFVDWIWGPTALVPADEPPLYTPIPVEWSSVPSE